MHFDAIGTLLVTPFYVSYGEDLRNRNKIVKIAIEV